MFLFNTDFFVVVSRNLKENSLITVTPPPKKTQTKPKKNYSTHCSDSIALQVFI